MRNPPLFRKRPTPGRKEGRIAGWMVLVTVAIGLAAGCTKPAPFIIKDLTPRADREAPWDPPNSYPEWAYDKPAPMKPAADLQPEPRARPEDPLHYFTNKKLIPIRRPGGHNAEEIPRIAVWWTDSNGFEWRKGGYFSRDETHFWFEAPGDGDYGIRFVGPGQAPAKLAIAMPERVYHVDTTLPDVQVFVEPNQAWYNPEQTVTLYWKAHDYHLIENPVEVGMSLDYTAEKPAWTVLQKDVAAEGSFSYIIPEEALDQGIVFRVAATDRAGNLGMAFSHTLQVLAEPVETVAPATDSDEADAGLDTGMWNDLIEDELSVDVADGDADEDVDATDLDAIDAARTKRPDGIGRAPREARPDNGAPAGAAAPIVDHPLPFPTLEAPDAKTAGAGGPPPTDLIDFDVLFESGGSEPIEALDTATAGAADGDAPAAARIPPVIGRSTVGDDPDAPPPPATDAPAELNVPPAVEPHALLPPLRDGLVAPLPATLADDCFVRPADRRPWLLLDRVRAREETAVWSLPRPHFMDDAHGLFEMLYLAENPETIPAAPGARANSPAIGVSQISPDGPLIDPALPPR